MEKNTTTTENRLEVYENEILYYLDEYQRKWNVDAHDIDLSRWNSCLIYIYKACFRDSDTLKEKPYRISSNNGLTNDNKYNLDAVKDVLSIYISICYEYSKEISISGFSLLTGISRETIYSWNSDTSTRAGSDIYKTLQAQREDSLSAKLYSSKGNPVGILGILNHFYGWNMGQPHGSGDTHPRTIEQIQEQYTGESNRIAAGTPPELAENTPPAPEDTPQAQEIPPTRENTPTPTEAPQRPQKPQKPQETQQAGKNTKAGKKSRRK